MLVLVRVLVRVRVLVLVLVLVRVRGLVVFAGAIRHANVRLPPC